MQAYIARTAPAKSLALLGSVFHEGAMALRRLARRVDTWLVARQRANQDWQELANMSDYELRDIGVCRASVHAIADGNWTRDYTR